MLSCGAFDVLHVIHFFRVPDKGSGVLICSKWQASQNPDVKWYTTYVSKGLECSQESNGFFSFSDYFFSYMVIVVSLITSVIHLCGCDLVSSLVKQNCFKLKSLNDVKRDVLGLWYWHKLETMYSTMHLFVFFKVVYLTEFHHIGFLALQSTGFIGSLQSHTCK